MGAGVLAVGLPGAGWVGAGLVGGGVAVADDSTDRLLLDPRISESSGLVASTLHPGLLWTHNDSGHPPELFAVGPDGRTVATLTLAGAQARDWEALAPGTGSDGRRLLWVGDIGDNRSVRPYVRVYRVVEPDRLADQTTAWTEYRLRYPDGAHDAEALLVDPRSQAMYVVTKAAIGSAVFALPRQLLPAPAVNVLTRVAAAPATVTDGAFAPDGSRLVLVGYLGGTVFSAVGGPGRPLALPLRPQGESVTWTDATHLLVGSEGVRSSVLRVALPPTASTAPTDLPSTTPTTSTAPTTRSGVTGAAGPAGVVTTAGSPAGWLAALAAGCAAAGGLVWFVMVRRTQRSRLAETRK